MSKNRKLLENPKKLNQLVQPENQELTRSNRLMPGWVENLSYTVLPSLNPKHLSHSHSHSRLSPLCHTHASHESRLSPLCLALTLTSFKLTSHASCCLGFFSSLFLVSPSQYRSHPPSMLCFIRYLDYFSFSFAFDCNLLIFFLSFVSAFDCNLLIIFFFFHFS